MKIYMLMNDLLRQGKDDPSDFVGDGGADGDV